VAGIILSCVFSLMLLGDVQREAAKHESGGFQRIVTLWTWATVEKDAPRAMSTVAHNAGPNAAGPANDFSIDITLRVDALTAMMLAMVTFVSSLVAIYSVGYMSGDHGFWRFFAFIGLFVFSMTMLVAASNFVLLFVFWEAVGLCSYLLIGFWYEKPEAAAAGKKAFLVNRVGDFAFLLGVFLIWTNYGTLNFHTPGGEGHFDVTSSLHVEKARMPAEVVQGALSQERIAADGFVRYDRQQPGTWVALAIPLLLLLGACGKSAQFPLHIWLPDAMEGPTPNI
jgi:NADH-quinone oxidoreductase subunit L